SGLAAAIFKNRLPVTSDSIRNGAIELLDPENVGLAVETKLLSCLEAEIYVLPVYWPPSWISDFRLHRTVFGIAPLNSWTPKMGGSRWNFYPKFPKTPETLGGHFSPPPLPNSNIRM